MKKSLFLTVIRNYISLPQVEKTSKELAKARVAKMKLEQLDKKALSK